MLLLLTIALVLVGAVALVIGFVNDAMFPIYLSIASSLLAAVVLVVFSRLSRSRMEPATAGPVVAEEPARPLRERSVAEFPIADYEDRRVAEIVPLLSDLDNDELEMVREREADGRNRTTVIRRIDDLLDERQGVADGDEEEADQGEDTLVSSAATFGRDDDEDLEDEDLEDEEVDEEDLFPIADYDDLTVDEILPVLDELTPDELEEVGDREAEGKNRDAILDRVDALLDEEEAAAPVKKKATKKKAAAKKAPAKKTAASKKKGAAKKAPAKKKSTAKKAPAKKKSTAKKAPAKKSGAKKSTAKKSAAKRAAR